MKQLFHYTTEVLDLLSIHTAIFLLFKQQMFGWLFLDQPGLIRIRKYLYYFLLLTLNFSSITKLCIYSQQKNAGILSFGGNIHGYMHTYTYINSHNHIFIQHHFNPLNTWLYFSQEYKHLSKIEIYAFPFETFCLLACDRRGDAGFLYTIHLLLSLSLFLQGNWSRWS